MDFSEALKALKVGNRVARVGWNGKGMWLKLVKEWGIGTSYGNYRNHFGSGDMLPFIGMVTVRGDFVPWLASQTDILAEDWEVVK